MSLQNENKEIFNQTKFIQTIIDHSNYILIGSLMVINVLISIIVIEDGSMKLSDFSSYIWLDWVLWVIITFIPAIISVIVRAAFQKEGISRAKMGYQDIINEHYSLIMVDRDVKVRSESEFIKEEAKKKSLKTLTTTLILSFFTGNILLGWDSTNMVKLAINVFVTLVVGFLAFTSSYSYGTTELKTWYLLDIKRLKDIEYQDMVKSGRYLPEVK